MRAAAQAQDEGTDEEEPVNGFFMIFDAPNAEESSSASSGAVAAVLPRNDEKDDVKDTEESKEAQEAKETEYKETEESTEKKESKDKKDADAGKKDSDESKKAEAPVEITLSDTIPFLSLEELDDIVKILTEQDILKAVTKDGKDITDQVKAEYRRISPRGNAYEVTFSVEYDGKTKEHVETAYVIN